MWSAPPKPPLERGIFCNRTLNLRSLKAIGYDMDYTLVHYNVSSWEERAYEQTKRGLLDMGWPVHDLRFDPSFATRGLILDLDKGNLLKVNRFGYVYRVAHGTTFLEFKQMRKEYEGTVVDLAEPRYYFLNTLFSISEACLYAQLVDLLDTDALPHVLGYREIFRQVRRALDFAHIEGGLKADIMAHPDRYVDLDPLLPQTLLDQRESGKKLLLITNSEWPYTRFMMSYAIDRFLPSGQTWRDLFDIIVVSARKPEFFSGRSPLFEVIDESGLLRPVVGLPKVGGMYLGGHARLFEKALDIDGEEILYIGDHIFFDVNISKTTLQWRTALILRELEIELHEQAQTQERRERLRVMMLEKEELEWQVSQARLALQRKPPASSDVSRLSEASKVTEPLEVSRASETSELEDVQAAFQALRTRLDALDTQISPLASAEASLVHPMWGSLLRAGNDKSHLTRQIEKHADIYTSRVSNFLRYSPFMYFRAPRGSLPHDSSR